MKTIENNSLRLTDKEKKEIEKEEASFDYFVISFAYYSGWLLFILLY